jgi:hypothetical protein
MDMKLAHFTLKTQIKVKEEIFYCCSTFDSHNRVFNNKHNSYPKMSKKQYLACSQEVLYISTDVVGLEGRHEIFTN